MAILQRRRAGRLRSIEDIGRPDKLLRKAAGYLKFGWTGLAGHLPSSSRKAPMRVSSCGMSSAE